MKETEKTEFPEVLDNTIISKFRECPHSCNITYFQHMKSPFPNVHLHAGGCFASAIEAGRIAFYREGLSESAAVAISLEKMYEAWGEPDQFASETKNLDRMMGALQFYWENYPLSSDKLKPYTFSGGTKGIEFSFAEPLEVLHPVTGHPILYSGRSDMVAEGYGGIYVVDEKTTSSLGAQWSRQWELRSQFTGYVWALSRIGVKSNGIIVRGVSILKTRYDTLEALTYRSGADIAKWYEQTNRTVRAMIKAWEEGYWDYNFGDACTNYGGCGLKEVCKSEDEDEMIKALLVKKVWDPLTRTESKGTGFFTEEEAARLKHEFGLSFRKG